MRYERETDGTQHHPSPSWLLFTRGVVSVCIHIFVKLCSWMPPYVYIYKYTIMCVYKYTYPWCYSKRQNWISLMHAPTNTHNDRVWCVVEWYHVSYVDHKLDDKHLHHLAKVCSAAQVMTNEHKWNHSKMGEFAAWWKTRQPVDSPPL